MESVKITKIENNIYILETNGHICKGFYKKINDSMYEIKLYSWYDKNTKRHKSEKNKLFKHMENWFCYMLTKYKGSVKNEL